MQTRPDDAQRISSLAFYGAILLVGYLGYLIVQPFLTPIGWALVLAICLAPAQARLSRRIGPLRSAATRPSGLERQRERADALAGVRDTGVEPPTTANVVLALSDTLTQVTVTPANKTVNLPTIPSSRSRRPSRRPRLRLDLRRPVPGPHATCLREA